jgi:hypothetical protein
MLTRWDSKVSDINIFVKLVGQLCPELVKSKGRSRPPKRSLKEYVSLIAIKEEGKESLRRAETEYSYKICRKRVDHSVIHYWEKKLTEVYSALVQRIGKLLIALLTPLFNVIDSTKFATWKQYNVEFHTLTTVAKETVFPTSVFFGSTNPYKATNNTITPGKGELMADRWYDDNKALSVMFENGYVPIVKPNSNRYHGYWRRKARRTYYKDTLQYKQRGRGESLRRQTPNNTYRNNKNKNRSENNELLNKALHKSYKKITKNY